MLDTYIVPIYLLMEFLLTHRIQYMNYSLEYIESLNKRLHRELVEAEIKNKKIQQMYLDRRYKIIANEMKKMTVGERLALDEYYKLCQGSWGSWESCKAKNLKV
jgi:hypothetical protein